MTPEQIADLPRLLERSTKGRRVQFHPDYCPEAKGTPFSDWDISHDTSVIRHDGSRYKGYAHHRHASDAELDGLAHDLARHLLTQQAQIDALAEDAARAHDLALEVERLKGLMWYAWSEFSAIRARSGAPLSHDGMQTVSENWWNVMTDAFGDAIGNDAQTPWPSESAKVAIRPRDTHAATAAVLSARDSIPGDTHD